MERHTARFHGINRLYGDQKAQAIFGAHICVIGIGGVGSWSVESLARTGVNRITLIDLDDICTTNINRQVHATSESVGQMKVDVMKERILSINPDCIVETKMCFFNQKNLEDILSHEYDVIIDAIDNINEKILLVKECHRRQIKVITTGAAGGKTDAALITVGDLTQAQNDRLLQRLRKELRQKHGFPRGQKKFQIKAIYSTEKIIYPDGEGNVTEQCPIELAGRNCQTGFGSSCHITASFGFQAASEAIKMIVNKDQ